MNIFKKFYCRTFQIFMRAAIPFMPYRQPEILQSVEDVAKVLKSKKIDKVLIVTDEGVVKCGLTDGLKESLTENAIAFAVYDKTMPNPTVDAVESARAVY